MRGLGKVGAIAAPKIHLPTPFKFPKAPAAPAVPKIRAIKIAPVTGGFHVQHAMSHGGTQHFVFSNPAKMVTHLRRIQKNGWMKPGQDPAGAIVHDLNIGETP